MNRWIKYALLFTLVATVSPKKGCGSKKCNCPHFMADNLSHSDTIALSDGIAMR